MGEREKDTSYPASLFPLRLKTRVWGHFFTQLNTNIVDHWETWQHGTRKSEAESVCDKQGEIPPLILYPSYTLTSPFNTPRVINTVKSKLLSVFKVAPRQTISAAVLPRVRTPLVLHYSHILHFTKPHSASGHGLL